MKSIAHSTWLSAVFVMSIAGCSVKRLERELAAEEAAVARDTRLLNSGDRTTVSYTWDQALKRLEEHNLTLRQGRETVKLARVRRERQWRTWLPVPTASITIRKALDELGSFDTSDLNASLFAALRIPNPLSEQGRAYANALGELSAEANYEVQRRRQIISLYQAFVNYEQLAYREKIMREQATQPTGARALITGQIRELVANESSQRAKQQLDLQLSRLLNLPGREVAIRPATRPKLDYTRRIQTFRPGENYGGLAVRLAVYNIQSAVLAARGVDLSRLPQFSASGSLPPILDTGRDEAVLDTFDDLNLFSSLTKSFDFTGRQADSLDSARKNVEFVRENLALRLDSEALSWQTAQKRASLLRKREAILRARIKLLLADPDSVGSIAAGLEDLRSARRELNSIKQAKERLSTEIWLWDDKAW